MLCLKVKAKYRGVFYFLNKNPKKCPYLFPFRLTGHTGSRNAPFHPPPRTDLALSPGMGPVAGWAAGIPLPLLPAGSGLCCRLAP